MPSSSPAHALLLGSHLSIAGWMVNALHEARSLGMTTVQVFTKNQQQWKAPPLDAGVVREWNSLVHEWGWDGGGPKDTRGHARGRIVSHASYLINLASASDELFAKSIDLMTDEIERCAALTIPFLVHHPGSFVGWTLEQGIARIASAYKELFKRSRGMRVVMCLEGTAGAGSQIGGPFEHLRDLRAQILDAAGEPERVGFCLDTCHLHAAGHDMSTRESARAVLARFDELCGVQHLMCFHLNDSLGSLASHLDRHTHIGEGFIGAGTSKTDARAGTKSARPRPAKYSLARLRASGFVEVLSHPRCRTIPLILETPKKDAKRARHTAISERLDTINMERLFSLLEDVPAQKPRRARRLS